LGKKSSPKDKKERPAATLGVSRGKKERLKKSPVRDQMLGKHKPIS